MPYPSNSDSVAQDQPARMSGAGERILTAAKDALWPCGHQRTPENSQRVGKAGVRCRECRRRIARDWWRDHRGKKSAHGEGAAA